MHIRLTGAGDPPYLVRMQVRTWVCTLRELSDGVWRNSELRPPVLYFDLTLVSDGVPTWPTLLLSVMPRIAAAELEVLRVELPRDVRWLSGGIPWLELLRVFPGQVSIYPYEPIIRDISDSLDIDDGEGEDLYDRLIM